MNRISRRTVLAGTGALLGGLALSACRASGPATGRGAATLRLPAPNVGFPSPFAYRGGVGLLQASYLYDSLLWKDPSGAYIPWLATTFDRAADGRTYTIGLREGVTWHDGRPFTADDVVFTFEHQRRFGAVLPPSVINRPNMANIERVEGLGPHSVRVVLRRPDWTFEQFNVAAGMFVVPRHVWEPITDPAGERRPEVLVGTGPYRAVSPADSTGAALYEAVDGHFAGTPAVRRIEHRPVDDELAALLAGEVDAAGGVGPGTGLRPSALAPFRDRPEFRIVEAPGHTLTALYWNLAAGGAFADPRFRRACARAIDRDSINQRVFEGAGLVAATSPLPPSNPYRAAVPEIEFDRAAADSELDAAGYRRGPDGTRRDADGKPMEYELLVSRAQPLGPVELVGADLAAVGIRVTPVVVDLPAFQQRVSEGRLQLSMTTFGGTNTDEQPDGLGKLYSSESQALQRAQGYRNPEMDHLVVAQRAQLDQAERVRTAARIQEIAAAELPMLPLVHPPLTTVVSTTEFDGWVFPTGGIAGLVPSVADKRSFVGGAG
ncbi:ABC transporter substrate-binding protein [Saccharopolyspora sp. CA-218241]|uniref:ABC transporter substrate-binding protein n=1 Tax=Saccharopolyspora sp. CA-218241 TaxID=3240027 RepID=UPI003D9561FA